MMMSSVPYFLHAQEAAADADVTVITIANARQTEYKKNEETDEDSIILTGAVEISVQKGNSYSYIKADKVSYNRKTEMLYAEGNVEINTKKSSGEGGESSTADSLLMNTSTLEGVFNDGRVVQTQSDALNLPSGSTLIVFSDIFGKSESNTIAFKNSRLTFCDDEDPHWHIRATRTWLLPGGEFAFFNALLFVGSVPVFYFPAFYYPKDELIFNPVFGFSERDGYYFQTTTYLYGRKPLDSDSSSNGSDESLKALYNFMKPSTLKKQERQGLVLHNLDEDFTGDTSQYFKILGDWYSNTGGLIGAEGKFNGNQIIRSINFGLDTAFSKTVFYNSGVYSSVSSVGETYWDKSNFLGLKLPFRYSGNVDFVLSKPFNISFSFPFYSDPYFNSDFSRRSETMDWINLLTSSSSKDDYTVSEISSFTWKISSSYSMPVPDKMKPYLSSAGFSASSSLNISSTTNSKLYEDERAKNSDNWSSYTPERKFYYPSQVVPINASISLGGIIYEYPKKYYRTNPSVQFPVDLNRPDELKSEQQLEKEKQSEQQTEENGEKKTEEKKAILMPELPVITGTQVLQGGIPSLTYSLSYSATPNASTQLSYDSNSISSPDNFKWDNVQSSMYVIKVPVFLNSSLDYGGNFLSLKNSFSYEPVWQKHPILKGYSDSQKKQIELADLQSEKQSVINSNTLSIKPFVYVPMFSESGITWTSSLKLFEKKFSGTVEDPEWSTKGLDFTDSDSVTVNTLNFIFAAKEKENKFRQTFTFSSTLSPQIPRYSFALNLDFPYVNFYAGTSVQQKSKDDSTWIKNPVTQSLSFVYSPFNLKLNESLSFNLEDNCFDRLDFSVSWKDLSLSYSMVETYGYDFNESSGWVAKNDKEFLPYSLRFSYAPSTPTYYMWSNRISISPGVSTSIVADLIRPTNSYLIFTPSLSFRINEFLEIKFSSTSRNSVLYRYFQSMLGYDGRIPGEQNIFIDLFDSFNFAEPSKRKASGFKLKSLDLTVSHKLHDWDFSMQLKFEPRLLSKNGTSYYDYSPYFSLGIIWNPMSSIKTQITDNYGTLEFN